MQLYILDKDPIKSAQLIPDKYKFKMLIELGQLICSAGTSDVYKYVKQGKELQEWIKNNNEWIYYYYDTLFHWAYQNIKLKLDTIKNLKSIWKDLYNLNKSETMLNIQNAYFRYAKEYNCDIPSKTLLPIDECIAEYKKYLEWKIKR